MASTYSPESTFGAYYVASEFLAPLVIGKDFFSAQEAGIGCWIGGMLERAVGAGICLELASMSNMVCPSDLFPTSRFYTEEISENDVVFSSPAKMKPSNIFGNAFVPLEDRLRQRTLAHKHAE